MISLLSNLSCGLTLNDIHDVLTIFLTEKDTSLLGKWVWLVGTLKDWWGISSQFCMLRAPYQNWDDSFARLISNAFSMNHRFQIE